jgi:hypothetical protein
MSTIRLHRTAFDDYTTDLEEIVGSWNVIRPETGRGWEVYEIVRVDRMDDESIRTESRYVEFVATLAEARSLIALLMRSRDGNES